MTSTFHDVLQVRPRVLIFLPNTNELQRFVLANAFADLATDHELHYVVPRADAEKSGCRSRRSHGRQYD